MVLRIYNTLSKKKEEFIPLSGKQVGLYTCGITAYDYSHIGHARSAVVFDVVVRYLRHRGYEVRYVRNFTDIDDKIIKRSLDQGVETREIAQKFIGEYRKDMEALGTLTPDEEPLATSFIGDMIEAIQKLIEKGYAYQVENDVYYSVEKFSGYGKLSHRDTEQMVAGSRVEVDERKRNPLDFALWKSAKPGEPWWESPWGRGRPGWHIECSVMSTRILGPTLDIHGGGKDLIFPHHENEIAQAEGVTGKQFARYWMHNGFVNMGKDKMSKSLGNVLNIRDILKVHHPEVVRFFLLSKHYRSPLDYSPEIMQEMENALERIYTAFVRLEEVCKDREQSIPSKESLNEDERDVLDRSESLTQGFMEAMDDDFNTARAIGYLFPLVKSVNRLLDASTGELSETSTAVLTAARKAIREICSILGILQAKPDDFFALKENKTLREFEIDRDEIDRLVAERSKARKEKNWTRADEIRDKLKEWNIVLEDTPEGTSWRIG